MSQTPIATCRITAHLLDGSSSEAETPAVGVTGEVCRRAPCSESSVQMAGMSPSKPRGSPASQGGAAAAGVATGVSNLHAQQRQRVCGVARSMQGTGAAAGRQQHGSPAAADSIMGCSTPKGLLCTRITCVEHPRLLGQGRHREHEGDAVPVCQRHAAALPHSLAIHIRAVAAQVLQGGRQQWQGPLNVQTKQRSN